MHEQIGRQRPTYCGRVKPANIPFCRKGLLKQFVIDDQGKKHILQFAPKTGSSPTGQVPISINLPEYFIQAIEDSNGSI